MAKLSPGTGQSARSEAAAALGHLLADSYFLYLNTHGYHWNVVGSQFEPLHCIRYSRSNTPIWRERVTNRRTMRTPGFKAPGSFSELASLTSITEETGALAADGMLDQMLADHMTASRAARQVVASAEAQGDVATEDLAIQRAAQHEKTAWMAKEPAAKVMMRPSKLGVAFQHRNDAARPSRKGFCNGLL